MKVSIIMPFYNAFPYLEGSVMSVLSQSYMNWELLLIDDCSSDGSTEQALRFSALDPRIKYIRNLGNLGVAGARNVGLREASGDYLAFLDSDDQWLPHKLELQVSFALSHSADVTYCPYVRVFEGRVIGHVRPKLVVRYLDMLRGNCIGNLTAMCKKDLADEVFFKSVGHEDYVFWLDIINKAGQAYCVNADEPLARYMVRKDSLSSNKFRAAKWQWQNYRDCLGFSIWRSSYYFSQYAFFAALQRMGFNLRS